MSKNRIDSEKRKNYYKLSFEDAHSYPLSIDERIGLISDTHFGSIYAAYDKLAEFYDHASDLGVKQVFHAGDITDGSYDGEQRQEELEPDFRSHFTQVNKVIKKYPKKTGIETFMIMGNHDELYLRRDEVNILERIAASRPDIKNCGSNFARFVDAEKNIKLDLHHPHSWKGFPISYGAQKYLDEIEESRHPNILCRGHMHQRWFGKIHNVIVFEAGCYQYPSPKLASMGYQNDVGGWIADLSCNKKRLKSVKAEMFPLKLDQGAPQAM